MSDKIRRQTVVVVKKGKILGKNLKAEPKAFMEESDVGSRKRSPGFISEELKNGAAFTRCGGLGEARFKTC